MKPLPEAAPLQEQQWPKWAHRVLGRVPREIERESERERERERHTT